MKPYEDFINEHLNHKEKISISDFMFEMVKLKNNNYHTDYIWYITNVKINKEGIVFELQTKCGERFEATPDNIMFSGFGW